MRYFKYLIIISASFLPVKLFAQRSNQSDVDITGLWKGTLYNDTTKKYYRYEIGISEEKGKLSGFSHTFFLAEDKEYFGVKKVKIKRADGKIIIEDAGLIADNYPVDPAKGVRQLNILTLEIKDSVMTLSGPFSTNRTREYSSLTGTISLQRKNDFWQSALVPHLQELGLSNNLSFVKKESDRIAEETKKAKEKESIASVNNNKTKDIHEADAQKEESVKPMAASVEPTKGKIENAGNEKQPTNIKENSTKQNKPGASTTNDVNSKKVASQTESQPKNNSKESKEVNTLKVQETVAADQSNKKIANKEVTKTEEKAELVSKGTILEPTSRIEADGKNGSPAATGVNEIKQQGSRSVTTKINKTELVTRTKDAPVVSLVSKVIPPAAEVDKRTNIVQETVYFTSDSLQLSLYDNGVVDGDTVSVLMNGNIIMARAGLSTNAVRKTIYAGPGNDSIELVMYAENLGSIAPNTGLLVVHDGKSIYEIRFSGDLNKNASIILKRRKN